MAQAIGSLTQDDSPVAITWLAGNKPADVRIILTLKALFPQLLIKERLYLTLGLPRRLLQCKLNTSGSSF